MTYHSEINQPTEFLDVGLYKNLSYADYDAQDAITRRHLIIDRNWERTRYNLNAQREETEAMIFGRALHSVVLSPKLVDKEFFFCEEFSKATKEGKERWKEVETEAAGRQIIRGHEVYALAAAVARHGAAATLLTEGDAEISLFWKEGIDFCKARIDYLKADTLVELKTTISASPRSFLHEIVKYGYHFQLAWYRRGLRTVQKISNCEIIAVEKTPPYSVCVYRLTTGDLDRAEKIMLKRLDEYRQCQKTGWKGYPAESQSIALPEWAFDHNDLTYELPF